ncbi:MAG TPA: helix-hairpin-helix domain-containing protein [Dysgonamonadaceae bacterium]|nr:helix-hairpin-helix domain-containing protein [Dysgonamonadaceae bacterium]
MTRSLLLGFIISSCSFISLNIKAQTNNWRSHIEQLAEEDMDELSINNMFEELSMLEQNPMNLNSVTRNQLESFPLLSINQANAIADFLEKNRPIYTVFELRNVFILDYATVELILPFFYVGELNEKREPFNMDKFIKHSRHNVQTRFDKTLNKRAGYRNYPDSILEKYPNRKYVGEDFYHSLKYSVSYRDKFQAGVVAEKDAGEPFLKPDYKKGYDHYGFHLMLRNVGKLRALTVGDYRLSFGQGLVLNNDFMLGKSFFSTNTVRQTALPKRHFSTAESGFFRGTAAVVRLHNVDITTFYSNQSLDANTSSEEEITSFKTDGYHRTPLDFKKRNNTREQVMGANINYRLNRLQIGVSGLHHSYNRIYNPTLRYYNADYWRGSRSYNLGVDYSYRFSKFNFAGETARSENGTFAHIHILEYFPSSLANFTFLYRNYPSTYQAMYAKAFGDGGRVQNERGAYLGTTFYPLARVTVSMFADFVKFPAPKYNTQEPSSAIDLYAMATYTFSRETFFEARYKFKRKDKNVKLPNDKETIVLPYHTHKLRLRYLKTLSNGWYFRTTIDLANYQIQYFPYELGYMVSQNFGHRGNKKIQGDGFIGYFNSDSYNSRLYSYERNILSTFYMPSFYGKGLRVALSARWNIRNNLSFSVKASQTRYFNRDVIGSATEQINGNSRTDVFTYLVWKF